MARAAMDKVLPDFPDVKVESVDFLTHLGAARASGVRSIPALVGGGRKLTGILLSAERIRDFFESIDE